MLTDLERKILEDFSDEIGAPSSLVAERLGISTALVTRAAKELASKGLLEDSGWAMKKTAKHNWQWIERPKTDGGMISKPGASTVWKTTEAGRTALAGKVQENQMAARKKTKKPPTQHRAPADEHAATELVLYIENTSDLSPDGPHGQGRSVLLNALRKWRRGTYDPTMAVRLFEYLTESGAKRYAKEMGSSEKEWSTMFTPATRHEAARQLEESFRNSLEHGEYDHVDTRIGMHEGHVGATRENNEQSLYDKLKAAGQKLDHHESDLYVLWTPEAGEIIRAHGGPEASNARPFTGSDGKRWIDIPFAYTPWWRQRRSTEETPRRPRPSVRETVKEHESLTYGQLPSFEDFKRHIHTAINPETDEPYWPEGTTYPMELVSAREIELAKEFGGLDDFRTERHRTGRNTRATGFRGDEKQIYDFLVFLMSQEDAYDGEEDSPGSLASSIMTTLGYEWV